MNISGVLTNKQLWRRQSNKNRKSQHDFFYNEGINNNDISFSNTRSISDQSISQHSNTNPLCRAWATTGDLVNSSSSEPSSSTSKQDRYKQKVRFNSAVKVILIPTLEEYKEAQLSDSLWWCEDHYKEFKKSALAELKLFLLTYSSLDTKSALKIIYQPNENSQVEDIIHKSELESMSDSSVLKSLTTCPKQFDRNDNNNFNNNNNSNDNNTIDNNDDVNNNNKDSNRKNDNSLEREEEIKYLNNSQEQKKFNDILIAT